MVYLTRLGGGAFGNDADWIAGAVRGTLAGCRDAALDLRIVSRGDPAPDLLSIGTSICVLRPLASETIIGP